MVLRLKPGDQAYVKRIVGLPGEAVQLESSGIAVDGETLSEPYVSNYEMPAEFIGRQWALGPDDYLVLGDLRSDSWDSRRFGPISPDQMIGPILARYWPPSRWRWLGVGKTRCGPNPPRPASERRP